MCLTDVTYFLQVYLASWFGTEVAVKILIVGHVASASEAQRALSLSAPIMQKLEAEASLLASLRHPHVVNFLGICHEPPCIVTEFCARGSLCDLLAAARSDPEVAAQLSWRRRLTMAADAAVGMLYLHSRSSPAPIIHRDLKSPNLLVDANWSVKVTAALRESFARRSCVAIPGIALHRCINPVPTDFNLSKILEDTTHSTSMAAMNPRWLAPEVMRGGRATKASDVYSFGIVLWELLTWQLPFGPANPWHLVAHVLAGGRLDVHPIDALPGPDTAAFGGGGLEGYLALMRCCWAQAPEQRPGFQQVVQELRALLKLAPPEQQ
ncbi:hypothetical protein COHA_007087 [Chlorella ohadii]|uniref:Protein kinase domain-containing protein n=1 Tax=Chlorella ohadii TaxID=2649997 RepID=A0AAD5DMT7_9CHLO|nr:hypothetical protein COHA_007087 [Chlorella ohadii]